MRIRTVSGVLVISAWLNGTGSGLDDRIAYNTDQLGCVRAISTLFLFETNGIPLFHSGHCSCSLVVLIGDRSRSRIQVVQAEFVYGVIHTNASRHSR